MGQVVACGAKPETPHHDEQILVLKVQRDKLNVRSKQLKQVVLRSEVAARDLLAQNCRNLALKMLKRRSEYLGLVTQAEDQADLIEKMIRSVESSIVQAEVVKALSDSTATLKRLNAELSLDFVQDVMHEAEEARETQDEIREAIGAGRLEDFIVEEEYQRMVEECSPLVLPVVPKDAPIKETPINSGQRVLA